VTAAERAPTRPFALGRRAALGALALLLWPLGHVLVGAEGTLVLWVRPDAPIEGGELRWSTHRGAGGERPLAWDALRFDGRAPIEVEIMPLGRRRPERGDVEVWLASITSRCGPVFRPERLRVPHGWLRGHLGLAAVWPGGEARPLRYKAVMCGPVEILLGHHPYSGRVRLRLLRRGRVVAERTADVHAEPDGRRAGYWPEAVPWSEAGRWQAIEVSLPHDAAGVDVGLRGPSATEVRASWTSARGAGTPPTDVVMTPTGVTVRAREVQPRGFWMPAGGDLVALALLWLAGWLVAEGVGGGTRTGEVLRRGWRWARYGAIPALVWSLYALAFYPGVLAYDPFVQWHQLIHGRYEDWHPLLHTWLLGLIAGPFDSFAPVTIVQVIATALLVAALLARARRLGAPAWLVWATSLWFALSPAFAYHVIAVWKDTPFTLALVGLTILLLDAIGPRTLTVRGACGFGTLLATTALLRHNGAAAALAGVAVLAWIVGRTAPGRVLLATGVALALVVLVRGPVYRMVDVAPAPRLLRYATLLPQVAALLGAGAPLDPSDAAYLERILPLDRWRRPYECFTGVGLLHYEPLHATPLEDEPGRLPRIWARLVAERPDVAFRHWRCATAWVWHPRAPLYIGPLTREGQVVDPNEFGVTTTPQLPSLHATLTRVLLASYREGSWSRLLVWQPAFALWVMLAALAALAVRARSLLPVLPFLPALGNTVGWLLTPFSPDARYQWPVEVLAPLALCLAVAAWLAPPPGVRRVTDQRP
jgi:hypothetical protein